MKDRISEFLKAENKSSAQFAEEIGVLPSAVSHVLSGRNNPSLDFVLKMLSRYPFISVEWLLFARGTMYKDQQMQDLFSQHEIIPEQNMIPESAFNDGSKAETASPDPDPEPFFISSGGVDSEKVTRIVWFFADNTFSEYRPVKAASAGSGKKST